MAKINKLIPHYDRRKRKWRVVFPDGNAEEGGLYYVRCEICGAQGARGRNEREAMKLWNKREGD